ncbi:MAG: porin family protein [Mucilaginibacter sp.]
MRRSLLTLCLAAMSAATFAQSTFGVKGGLNFSKLSYSNIGQDVGYSSDMMTTFQAGVFADFKVSESVSIQPALLYSVKGAKTNIGGPSTNTIAKTTIKYLHLPVNILFHKPLGKHELYFGGGPFISYALSGKIKGSTVMFEEGVKTVKPVDEKLKFTDTSNGIKRTDAGLEILAGFKFSNGFLVNLNYDFGLANIEYGSPTTRTRVLGVSVGYAFQ